MKNMLCLAASCMLYSVYAGERSAPLWYNLNATRYNDIVFQGHGAGANIQEASSAAWGAVFRNAAMAHAGFIESEIYDNMLYKDGRRVDSITSMSHGAGVIDRQGLTILKVLASYESPRRCDDGLYHCYILAALRRSRETIELAYPSNNGAVFRSLLLPGWGQIYKGNRRAGAVFFAGTAFCATASALLWSFSGDFYRKALDARTNEARTVYERRHEGSLYSSFGAAVFCGVFYTWNVFHARTTAGVPRLKQTR